MDSLLRKLLAPKISKRDIGGRDRGLSFYSNWVVFRLGDCEAPLHLS